MTPRKWFLVGAIFAVVGVLVAAFGIFYGNFSPRGYVQDRYSRAASHDIGRDAIAYTSNRPPSAVAKEVTDFRDGELSVRFEGISGRIDQGAGVLFNLKPNGDYLTIRAGMSRSLLK